MLDQRRSAPLGTPTEASCFFATPPRRSGSSLQALAGNLALIPDPFIFERAGADPLREGYYLHRVGGRRVALPVRIWFGPPIELAGEEPMDRSWRWQVQIAFQLLLEEPLEIGGIRIEHLDQVWPQCALNPIDAVDWKYRLERALWANEHDDADPYSQLGGKIDLLTCTLP